MASKKSKTAKKKQVNKVSAPRRQPQQIVLKVQSVPVLPVPTVQDLAEPMKDGKKLTMQKTWLAENQLLRMLQRTPREQVHQRKGRGGKEFDYVEGHYCIKWLNFNFGWNWDYEIVIQPTASEIVQLIDKKIDQVWVTGKLTVHSSDNKYSIVKTQGGKADIKYLKNSRTPVSIGDDLKAAATDALKKCASLLGFASDVYGKTEYKETTGKDPIEVRPQLSAPAPETESQEVKMKPGQIIGPDGYPTWACDKCGDPISETTSDFSLKAYGKRLCREHQPKK